MVKTEKLKFAVFADAHYKEYMYLTSIADLKKILDRAHKNDVDFIIHAGDFSNDYSGSPEATNAYLHNEYQIPAYGIYGNHELETVGNTMSVVTSLLNNREVVWGTADGKMGDGSIGYFYFDVKGFRIVCTDTNYSWNLETKTWEHNRPASWGWPDGNVKGNSLAPAQLEWLKKVLNDAVENELACIVFSHESFSGVWSASPDSEVVRGLIKEVNARRQGTVLMMINGHLHTNHLQVIDDVLYMDVNTVKNGDWLPNGEPHYGDLQIDVVNYDERGNEIGVTKILADQLWQAPNSYFFDEPLSAIVTVSTSGKIKVEGSETTWLGGIASRRLDRETKISSGEFDLFKNK